VLTVGVFVALIALVGGAIVLAGAGDDDDDGDAPASEAAPDEAGPDASATPEEVTAALFDAARAGDCEAVIELMAPDAFDAGDTPATAVAECEADDEGRELMAGLDVVDISLVSETGDRAVVAVTATVDGETSTEEMPLQRVDGEWLVATLD
jgi:hypothetical protein